MDKPFIIESGVKREFDTQAEHDAYVLSIAGAIDLQLIARLVEAEKAERIGKALLKDLYQTLRQQNLTAAQEADLMNRIFQVLTVIGFGFLNGALNMANALTVAGQLTNARKTFLINSITSAIAELNS